MTISRTFVVSNNISFSKLEESYETVNCFSGATPIRCFSMEYLAFNASSADFLCAWVLLSDISSTLVVYLICDTTLIITVSIFIILLKSQYIFFQNIELLLVNNTSKKALVTSTYVLIFEFSVFSEA